LDKTNQHQPAGHHYRQWDLESFIKPDPQDGRRWRRRLLISIHLYYPYSQDHPDRERSSQIFRRFAQILKNNEITLIPQISASASWDTGVRVSASDGSSVRQQWRILSSSSKPRIQILYWSHQQIFSISSCPKVLPSWWDLWDLRSCSEIGGWGTLKCLTLSMSYFCFLLVFSRCSVRVIERS
jgi:hypothetical protein